MIKFTMDFKHFTAGGRVTSYKYQYRDVPLEYVYFSAQRFYDKLSFSAS